MKQFLAFAAVMTGLVVPLTTPAVALGEPAAAQAVTVTYIGVGTSYSRGTFRLQAGNLSDNGSATSSITEESSGQHAGQSFIEVKFELALKSRRGTLVIRWRGRYVSAGEPWEVVTGTWSIAAGTGEYAGARGMGRIAGVFTGKGNRYFQRLQGSVTLA
jgi:hypothetical protein